jgi:hypothetical protein
MFAPFASRGTSRRERIRADEESDSDCRAIDRHRPGRSIPKMTRDDFGLSRRTGEDRRRPGVAQKVFTAAATTEQGPHAPD